MINSMANQVQNITEKGPFAWDKLSMREKAAFIKVGVANGLRGIDSIRQVYNEFAEGGNKSSWKEKHQNQWYSFLKEKGVSDADAQRLSGFFTAQDGLESAGGQSSAARQKNNFGGMQKGGKNISYDSVHDYMEDKWRMMNTRFKPALSAQSIDEYATILGNPDTAGKGYLYYVTDKVKYDPKSSDWRAAQTQHMNNYINGMRAWAGQPQRSFERTATVYQQAPIEQPYSTRVARESKVPVFPTNEVVIPPEWQHLVTPLGEPQVPRQTIQEQVGLQIPEIQQSIVEEPVARQATIEKTLPDTIITPQPAYRKVNPLEMLEHLNNGLIPLAPIQQQLPMTATEVLQQLDKDQINFLQRDLEDKIIRDNKLALIDDSLKRDAEWLKFRRNMNINSLGGNLYDGETEPTQQMTRFNPNYGLDTAFPSTYSNYIDTIDGGTLPEVSVTGTRKPKNIIPDVSTTLSNDNVWVENGNIKNPHLFDEREMQLQGEVSKAWAAEHPFLNDLKYALTAAPFAVAAYPFAAAAGSAMVGAGDAAATTFAATRAGQAATNLVNTFQAAANASKWWPYATKGLEAAFAGHGVDKLRRGDIHSVEDAVWTGLEVLPLFQLGKPVKEFVYPSGAFNSNYKNTQWYSKLVDQYGQEEANAIADRVINQSFQDAFFNGRSQRAANREAAKYQNVRDFHQKISGDPDEGKAILGGSPAIGGEGTITRSGAVPHDLDYMAYIGNASKDPNMSAAEAFIQGKFTLDNIRRSPIVKTISDAIGQDVNVYRIPSLFRHNRNVYRALHGLFHGGNNLYVSPMFNYQPGFGLNKVIQGDIKGIPLDVFLSETPIAEGSVTGLADASIPLGWKQIFNTRRTQMGLPSRAKDVKDLETFAPYSESNPLITEEGGQWSPFSFGNTIMEEGMPSIFPVETYPGSGQFIPAAMNFDGKFMPVSAKFSTRGAQILGDAQDFSYKGDLNAFELLTKRLYDRKIHGYPSSQTDAMEFINGEFVPVKKEWADDVSVGLPQYAQDILIKDVIDRNVAELIKEGLPSEEAAKYAEAAKRELNNVRIGEYSLEDYIKAGWDGFGGFYDPDRNFISVNQIIDPKRVYPHEGRHMLDHRIDDEILLPKEDAVFGSDFDSDVSKQIMQRTRQKQEMILRDAYDKDFDGIPSSEHADGLEAYTSMDREALTTNLDSRTYAYENFMDTSSAASKPSIEEMSVEERNAFIDGLTDDQVFDAVEHANGYGRRYIAVLRDKGKLTSKKAQQFRESMKHVGEYVIPAIIGGNLLYNTKQ